MKQIMMAGLLAGLCVLPARALTLAGQSYQTSASLRYVDLDTRGKRGQVQEYDGKLYRGAHGDVSVGNQGTYGLFDLSVKDIGSTEENATVNFDYKDTIKMSALWNNMHHRLYYIRVGQVHSGFWVPKPAITLRDAEDAELIMRRSESGFKFSFLHPESLSHFITAEYWGVDKVGRRSWSWTGNPNIQRGSVRVDNTTRDFIAGFGTLRQAGALSLDIIRRDFEDRAPKLMSEVDGAAPAGSSGNGGVIKRPEPRQAMMAGEFKFRYNASKDLALTGAFTARQRENTVTHYKFNSVVGALNAAYRVGAKLSLLGKLYFRAYQVDENMDYFPTIDRAGSLVNVNKSQFDKTTARGELVANYRPADAVNLKAAYKLEINNRRDAPTQLYSSDRYYADGFLVAYPWANYVSRNDVSHLFTLGAKAQLPLGIEAEAAYKRLQANIPAFVNLPNKQDDVNAMLTVPLPQNVALTMESGYVQEWNTIPYTQYQQLRNTYRGGLDWSGFNSVFLGADFSYENIRYSQHLYLGSPANPPVATGAFHQYATNRQLNTIYGIHARVVCPKGFVVMGNGSYTRSTVTTPLTFKFATARLSDFTPSNVNIARGTLAVEYTPETYKDLTARASYAVSDWVDQFDQLNSGRASVLQVGGTVKF